MIRPGAVYDNYREIQIKKNPPSKKSGGKILPGNGDIRYLRYIPLLQTGSTSYLP
jgi:hypothetical protein